MAELIKVLSKFERGKTSTKLKLELIEEMADVYIMLQALQDKYKIHDLEIIEILDFKIARMKKRFRNGEYM